MKPEPKLAVWDSQEGFQYLIVRLHDDDEYRLQRIEQKLDQLIALMKGEEHGTG